MNQEKKRGIEDYIFYVLLCASVAFIAFALVDMNKTADKLNKEGDFQLCRDNGGIPIPNWSGFDLARCDYIPR